MCNRNFRVNYFEALSQKTDCNYARIPRRDDMNGNVNYCNCE